MINILSELFSNMLFLILHVTGSDSFPRPLSANEERNCLKKMNDQDPATAKDARNKLIEHNLRLVAHVINNR